MTEKLFYRDSHMEKFQGVVQSCEKDGDTWLIVLDRTAFFPEGGGQYADIGYLGDVQVLDVQEKDGVIYHRTDGPLKEGTAAAGRIDWKLRFMKMQQHTGEHIVSGLVHSLYGYNNVGFHLGSTDCTMDFDGELTKEDLIEIEERANEAVVKNLPVEVCCPSRQELSGISYRSKIEIEGQVRIVRIPGYDTCACCAPHVKSTGEIGMIRLTGVQRYKGGVRVTMLCGFRALADYRRKSVNIRAISAALCVKEDETAQAVLKIREELEVQKQKNGELKRQLLWHDAEKIPKGVELAVLFQAGLSGDEIRTLMNLVLDRQVGVCAVFSGDEADSWKYVIASRSRDVRPAAAQMNKRFDGRGGGKPEMVQGSIKGREEVVRAWLTECMAGQAEE